MKKQWVHRARKLDGYTGDTDDKQNLIDIIRDEFGIHCITSEPIPIGKRWFIPDVETTDVYPTIYFELHGAYHGEPTIPTGYTILKREHYTELGLKMMEIWEDDTDGYSKELVLARLKALGLHKSL